MTVVILLLFTFSLKDLIPDEDLEKVNKPLAVKLNLQFVPAEKEWLDNFPFQKQYSEAVHYVKLLPLVTSEDKINENRHFFVYGFYESRDTKSLAFQKTYQILQEEGIPQDTYGYGMVLNGLTQAKVMELSMLQDASSSENKLTAYGGYNVKQVKEGLERSVVKMFFDYQYWLPESKPNITYEKAHQVSKRLIEEIPPELFAKLRLIGFTSDDINGKKLLIN